MTGVKHRGFTLMELLVVLGLFSITVTMASGIFLLSNRAQRRILAVTKAQGDIRYALEAIVREVRTGRVDYASYAATGGAVPIPAEHLIIKSTGGTREEYFLETSPTVCPTGVGKCLAMSLDGGPAQALTSSGIGVDSLAFYVSPQSDPFAVDPASGRYPSDLQPTVTIVIKARTVGSGIQDELVLNAQTTAASRLYER